MGVYRRGRIFYIDYWFEGYRVRERVGPDRKLAEAALAARKGEIVQGRFRLARINDLRLDVFSRQYLEYARTNKRSWDRDERLLRHLLRFFGGRKLHDISPFLVESYKKKRLEDVKPATVNREVALLKHMYNLAIQWGVASENPVKGVKLLREEPFQERVLNKEEADRLLAACTSHSRAVVLCALNTGMRIGEITSMKWSQVDLVQKTITLIHTKNGRVRKVPINDALYGALVALQAKKRGEAVFVNERTGQPLKVFRTAWLAALRRSGIGRCRFHDLRHTAASWMVADGNDLVTVMEILGHSNISTTLRYSHSAPEQKRRAVASLGVRFGGNTVTNSHKSVTNGLFTGSEKFKQVVGK